MTLQEFDGTGKYEKPCRDCSRRGMAREHNANNNGDLVVCPFCKSNRPWGALTYLKHTSRTHRKDDRDRDGCSLFEVWQRFKDRCALCTAPAHELFALGIGRSRHHVTERYNPAEVDCPIIPLCAACKTIVDARQREVWRWIYRLRDLKGDAVPLGRSDLPGDGLSPAPVRAAGETSAGPVEGLSDDDADD